MINIVKNVITVIPSLMKVLIKLGIILMFLFILLTDFLFPSFRPPFSDDRIITYYHENKEDLESFSNLLIEGGIQGYYFQGTFADKKQNIPKYVRAFVDERGDWDVYRIDSSHYGVSLQLGEVVSWKYLTHEKSLVYLKEPVAVNDPYLITGDTDDYMQNYEGEMRDMSAFVRHIEGHWYIHHYVTTDWN